MTLLDLFRNLRPYVRPYRWLVLLTLCLTFFGSLTAQVNAWVLRYTVDSINLMLKEHKSVTDGLDILLFISGILIGKEVLNVFIQFGQKYYGEKLRIYISRDLAQTVIEKILTYKLAFYSSGGNQPGKLQTRIDRGIESLTRLVQNFFIDILPLVASSVVALIMMFNANFWVGFLAFCTVPVYYAVARMQAKKLLGARRTIKSLRENKSQGILSILEAIPVIKSFLREDVEEAKQMDLQNGLTSAQMNIRKTSFLFDGLKSFIEQIGIVAIILLTTYFVLTDRMSIGAIMFHILLFNNVSAPIRRLHLVYDQMNDALIYSEGFFDILHADHQVEQSGSYRPETVHGHFVLHDVGFSYPENVKRTLGDISMDIAPGKITALVGLSGAGKSTLINLLDKFYQPDEGEILLDGVSLADYDTGFVRANIGLVLQKNHIFNGSVEENIRYGNPGASGEEVEEAARRAYLHEQVLALPDGYRSPARSLSGGQQQKIAIATEQIKNSLDAIKKDRTVVIVSHSISQIIDADRIYVMEKGRIVESGTHEEIYRMGGSYKKIFDAMARSLNVDKIARTLE